ncbi:MAG: hypothetical protein JOZ08_00165 [Verrucomicrobia bacterium]|nr:hypothetical protein [Verrucomicrobiota bacterium]
MVDPFISLNRQGPGLEALLTGSVISDELTASLDGLKQHVEKSLAALFQARCPKANRTEINRAAATSVQLVKSFLRIAVTEATEGGHQRVEDRPVPVLGATSWRMTDNK